MTAVGRTSSGSRVWQRLSLRAWLLALATAAALVGVAIGVHAARSGPAQRAAGSLQPIGHEQVSAAIGAGVASYHAHASAGGFRVQNAAQGLGASFSTAGLQIRSGKTSLGLRALGLAQGATFTPAGASAPQASANRVSFSHAGWSEWYSNGPLGLEQGFTIAHAPADGPGPLSIAMALSGNTQPTLADGGRLVRLSHGGSELLYGNLLATDARGRTLHSWLALRPRGRLQLSVDTRGARYPVRIDPLVQQGGKLTGSGATGASDMGLRVALSADGNTLLAGGPADSSGIGAAWVFTRSGSTWSQQGAKLTGAEEVGDAQFGYTVALSADGNTALIGGGKDNSSVGAAWVFTRSGSTWTQQGPKLTGSGESGAAHFGCCGVALSADGNTALIGGYADASSVGAAWVFTRSGSTWSQQGSKLKASGETGAAHVGYAVALSGDGNTALLGGGADNSNVGAAWVFTRSGSTWSQQGSKLTGAGEVEKASFGYAVALDGKGETALIGGGGDNLSAGAAWVFIRSGSSWSQQGSKLTGGEETGEGHFGCCSVALSESGNTALIGGYEDNAGAGAAWAFTRSGSTWSQYGPKTTGSGEVGAGLFGNGVALSADGRTAAVGADADASSTGAVWTYSLLSAPGVKSEAASAVTSGSATLNATVNPEGDTVTECEFEYGTTAAYGASAPCSSLPGSGTSPVAVSAAVSGLTPATLYHFRIVATNSIGTSHGADLTFTTPAGLPPASTTAEASAVAQTSATLNGSVNPEGENVTECKFEYGPSETYGKSAPCSPSPGSGLSPVAVSAAVTGLTPNATYHFRIHASNGTGSASSADRTFTTPPSRPPAVTLSAPSAVAQTSATLKGSVNPEDEAVNDCHFEYGPTAAYGSSVPCTPSPGEGASPVPVSAAVSGLTASTTYHYRIVATNPTGTSASPDTTLTTTESKPPVVATGEATSLAPTAATLNATVNPEDEAISDCHFEYGTSEAYGSSAPCSSLPGAGTSAVPVSAEISGLTPNTTYHFKIVATNPAGTSSGTDGSFKTPLAGPTVVSEPASSIGQQSAVLNATVNPNEGNVSDCHFEYGPSASYGTSAPCSSLPGSGTSPVPVSAAIAGLSAGATYHFRIVATSPGGTSYGGDRSFTTPTPALPEVGRCVSVTPATARYSTATCTTKSSGENTGKYEWRPWPAPKNGFTLKGLSATFESVKKVKVKCTASSGSGSYTGSQTAALSITFTGCEATPGGVCQSSGANAGEIVSGGLQGQLGFIENRVVSGKLVVKVGLAIKPSSGASLMSFTCGGTARQIGGAVIAGIAANKMATSVVLTLKATNGKQSPERFEGGVKETLTFVTAGGEEQAGQTGSVTLTPEQALEIKAS